MSIPNGRTDTERALDRIAAALERLADAIAPRPVASHTAAVSAALDVATDTDDPDADALLETAQDAIAKRLEQERT